MKKRILAVLLLAALLLPALTACPAPDNGDGTTPTTPTTPNGGDPSTPGEEPVNWDPTPENLKTATKYPYTDEATNTLYMTYGSSYTFENRASVKAETVVISSKQTGTENPDEALLVVESDGKTVTAVGTGSCTVKFLRSEMNVVVVPAPMNMLFVTGQSNAAAEPGSDGAPTSTFSDGFVRSEVGKAYYSHVSAAVSLADDASYKPEQFIPNNLVWDTCYTNSLGNDPRVLTQKKGVASFGPGWSGLARVWTEETGEAVWIVNSSFGGMPISTFQPSADGKTVDNNYYRSLYAFRLALETLYREVDAGHFVLNHMAYYWCQGESDSRTRTAKEYYGDFVNMHNGYMKDLVYDHNGVKKSLEFCGITALRSCYDNAGNSYAELHLTGPRLMQYYAAGMATGELSNVYVVSNATERWVGDDQNVVDYFTETYGSAEEFKAYFGYDMPTTRAALHPVIHYSIYGYNEISMDAGRNSLRIINLTRPENGYETSLSIHKEKPTVSLLTVNGYHAYGDVIWLDADTKSAVLYPAITPIYRTVEGLSVTTSTPGFRMDMYTLYCDDDAANAVEITVTLGGKTLAVLNFEVKRMGAFTYNLPNIVNHGTSGKPDHEYLGNRGSWTPGVFNIQTGSFDSNVKLQDGYAWLIPENQTVWYSGVGGFAGDSGYLYGTSAGKVNANTFLALAYTADRKARVGIGFSDLSNNVGEALLAVYVNGMMVFPAKSTSWSEDNWKKLDGSVDIDDLNEEAAELRFNVEAGDEIYFLLRSPSTATGSAQTLLHPIVYYHEER